MKKIILTLTLCLPLTMAAQSLSRTGADAENIVPAGWEHTESMGDLNKDGIADMVLIALPNNPEKIKTRDDGYQYNFNKPILAIYLGNKQGELCLWKEYGNVLLGREQEFESIDNSVNITPKGSFIISIQYFYSAGSYSNVVNSHTFRMQNGDFFKIGEEQYEMSRLTGEDQLVSYNYLTHKKQTVTANAMDEKVKKKEKWEKIPKSPLQRLGAEELY